MKPKQLFEGVFEFKGKIFTKNLVPKQRVYGEKLIEIDGTEYREWVPFRSKLGAGIKNGLKQLPLKEGSKVLYLGAAEGTTISHISDIIGKEGLAVGIDISARTMHKFVSLCELRENLVPILADANLPEKFAEELEGEKFDLLYQDISQKNQAEIFLKNACFLKPTGFGLIAIKARSISQSKKTKDIFEEEIEKLKEKFKIIQAIDLKPFEKEHVLVLCQLK